MLKIKHKKGNVDAYAETLIENGFPALVLVLCLVHVSCCKHKVHDSIKVLHKLYVRYFVSYPDCLKDSIIDVVFLLFKERGVVLHPDTNKQRKTACKRAVFVW